MLFNGTWTYVIKAAEAGGVIVARDGKLVGGDSSFWYSGTVHEEGRKIEAKLHAMRFNWEPKYQLTSLWGQSD